jgi:RNA polymerase sigma-70 factor (ECF subfamily)
MTEEAARLNEKELICRAVDGDAEAFGDLYVHYLDDIYRYIFYRVRDEKRAEDLTERVFMSAWEAIEGYQPRGYPFSSWLYRIAHNAVVDYYRADRDEKPLDAMAFTLADESLGPEESLIKKREVSQLVEAIAQLSEEKQRLIILRFVEGLSHAQVAQILGKSEGACRVIQHRALGTLNEIMGRW